MHDGSDAVADWPILNALLNAVAGATWVSVHHGGGVGMGYSIHAGMVVVADGTRGGGAPPAARAHHRSRARASCATPTPATSAPSRWRASAACAIPMLAPADGARRLPPRRPRAGVARRRARRGAGAARRSAGRRQDDAAARGCRRRCSARASRSCYLDLMGAASSPERFLRIALDVIPAAAAAPALPLATEIRRLAGSADRRQVAKAVGRLLESVVAARRLGKAAGGAAPRRGHRDPLARLLQGPARRRLAVREGDARAQRRHGARNLLPDRGAQGLRPRGDARAAPRCRGDRAGCARQRCPVGRRRGARGERGHAALSRRAPRCRRAGAAGRVAARRWPAAAASSRCAGTRTRPCCCAAAATASARRCCRRWRKSRDRTSHPCARRSGARPERCASTCSGWCWWTRSRMVRKRYVFVDPLIGHWVRLHARGVDATTQDLADAFAQLGGTAAAAIPAAPAPRPAPARSQPPRRPASDQLMEID